MTTNSGLIIFSGDDTTTVFTIPHGLGAYPTLVSVTAASHNSVISSVTSAAIPFWVTKDDTNLYVNYNKDIGVPITTADANNISFEWVAGV